MPEGSEEKHEKVSQDSRCVYLDLNLGFQNMKGRQVFDHEIQYSTY
jgi:hypothetical protein